MSVFFYVTLSRVNRSTDFVEIMQFSVKIVEESGANTGKNPPLRGLNMAGIIV